MPRIINEWDPMMWVLSFVRVWACELWVLRCEFVSFEFLSFECLSFSTPAPYLLTQEHLAMHMQMSGMMSTVLDQRTLCEQLWVLSGWVLSCWVCEFWAFEAVSFKLWALSFWVLSLWVVSWGFGCNEFSVIRSIQHSEEQVLAQFER
jgi:hypothetical protein